MRKLTFVTATRAAARSVITIVTGSAAVLLLAQTESSAQRSLNVRVSFYSSRNGGGRTATGRSARLPGVAVDPRVIPLGSQVSVPGFGVLVADDTGGAIKGHRIDVRLTDGGSRLARKHGIKHLRVRVVRPTKRER